MTSHESSEQRRDLARRAVELRDAGVSRADLARTLGIPESALDALETEIKALAQSSDDASRDAGDSRPAP